MIHSVSLKLLLEREREKRGGREEERRRERKRAGMREREKGGQCEREILYTYKKCTQHKCLDAFS